MRLPTTGSTPSTKPKDVPADNPASVSVGAENDITVVVVHGVLVEVAKRTDCFTSNPWTTPSTYAWVAKVPDVGSVRFVEPVALNVTSEPVKVTVDAVVRLPPNVKLPLKSINRSALFTSMVTMRSAVVDELDLMLT